MTHVLTHDDAPSPTASQVEIAARVFKRRQVLFHLEGVAVLISLVVLPVVFGLLTWWFMSTGPEPHPDKMTRIFFGVAGCAFCFSFILYLWTSSSGRYLTPRDLQEFHCADLPIGPKHWNEVAQILEEYPVSIAQTADWVAAYDGTLLYRHLWELRRRHTAIDFSLEVVETTNALDANWVDTNERGQVLPQGPADILDGRLLMHINAQHMKDLAPSPRGASAPARL